MSEVKKQSAFKVWTEKHADLWQIIKFTMVSMIAGGSELVIYLVLGNVVLTSLSGNLVKFLIFDYSTAATGGLCMLVAYLVSTTVGNFVSFVVNRKTTFKSVANVKFSVIATMVMIVFIIFYSTVLGAPARELVRGWFANFKDEGIWKTIIDTISKFIITTFTFVFVFVMNKFVILREEKKTKEQKEAEKKAAEERAARPSKTVINQALTKKFMLAMIVLLSIAIIGIAVGIIAKIAAALIIGSIFFGVGYIVLIAFAVEAIGTKVPVDELGEFEGKAGYVIKEAK